MRYLSYKWVDIGQRNIYDTYKITSILKIILIRMILNNLRPLHNHKANHRL